MSIRQATGEFFGETCAAVECGGTRATALSHRRANVLPPHSHRAPYFSLLVLGAYREKIARQQFDYGPLTLVFHPPGTHHVDELGPAGATFLTLELSESWLKVTGCDLLMDRNAALLNGEAPWLALFAFEKLIDGALAAAEVEALSLDLCGALSRLPPLRGTFPSWLARVEERICDDPCAPLSVVALAQEAGVHPVHLARRFRQRHGVTLATFALDRRLDLARPLLARGIALADVAAQLGFADQSHFTRSFRRRTRGTPGIARNVLQRQRRAG